MDIQTKLLLGRILGEVFRLQRMTASEKSGATQAQIYGLIEGFEGVIDEFIPNEFVSEDDVRSVMDILDAYSQQKQLNGYYEIENELNSKGIDRSKAIAILYYLKANQQYLAEINSIQNGYSPTELRHLNLDTLGF